MTNPGPTVPIRERMQTRDRFWQLLLRITQQRHEREDLVAAPDGGQELAWVAWEAEQMHALVNEIRAGHGLEPVGIDLIREIEASASGHSDYAAKYALRSAFLALGMPEWRNT